MCGYMRTTETTLSSGQLFNLHHSTANVCVVPEQVRWFSFQFLMQQLSEELAAAHAATQLVLGALPKPPKKGRQPLQPARELLLPQ